MEPSRGALLQLLELQKVDSTIDRLQARLRNLPEQAELDNLEEGLAGLEKSIGEQQAILDDIVMRQGKLEADIEMISSKVESESAKLYSGQIANPKELAGIQDEIEGLKRRRSSLEDSDLEVMEEREGADSRLNPLNDEAAEVRRKIEEAIVRRDQASADIDRQLAAAQQERGEWVPKIDPELLERYDDLRAAKAGVGAAALIGGVCQGCHMRLANQEVERVRKAEGLIFCDECRRILVVM